MAFLPPFERNECSCTDCVQFCYTMPSYLIPGDIFSIADHLISVGRITIRGDVFKYLRASKGAVVGEAATGKRYRIGTITPRVENGRCVFLTNQDRCSIHSVAPFGCRMFTAHMDRVEGDFRSMWGLRQIARTPGYEALRQKLIADSGVTEPFSPLPQEDTGGQSKG